MPANAHGYCYETNGSQPLAADYILQISFVFFHTESVLFTNEFGLLLVTDRILCHMVFKSTLKLKSFFRGRGGG